MNIGSGRIRGEQSVRHAGRRAILALLALAALTLGAAPDARADRTPLKPGWNMFSAKQDIELGKKASLDAERQLPMCNDAKVDEYLNRLGRRLAAKAPTNGVEYPFQFRCVNERSVNAFALPGGYVYVHRGTIEAADNEAQLAGVMAHEISHVALRHGTNQASKASAMQLPLAVLGGALGSNATAGLIQQLAVFGAGSVLLKYSRSAETQADVMGTQILYDTGYDPRAMAQFFEKIEAESKGKDPPEFFSNHPNPEHRIERVDEEVQRLGGPPRNYRRDSPEFQSIKREVLSLPAPPKGKGAAGGGGRPARPSNRALEYRGAAFTMKYPENWQASGEGNAVSFFPEGGVLRDKNGQAALAYGMIVNVAEPHGDPGSSGALEESTDQLVEELQHSNPGMRMARRHERIRLNGERALSTYLTNESPAGGRETDWLVTVLRPEGLLYIVSVAPDAEYGEYDRAFSAMLDSLRFRR